jgi:hypothetical protein
VTGWGRHGQARPWAVAVRSAAIRASPAWTRGSSSRPERTSTSMTAWLSHSNAPHRPRTGSGGPKDGNRPEGSWWANSCSSSRPTLGSSPSWTPMSASRLSRLGAKRGCHVPTAAGRPPSPAGDPAAARSDGAHPLADLPPVERDPLVADRMAERLPVRGGGDPVQDHPRHRRGRRSTSVTGSVSIAVTAAAPPPRRRCRRGPRSRGRQPRPPRPPRAPARRSRPRCCATAPAPTAAPPRRAPRPGPRRRAR